MRVSLDYKKAGVDIAKGDELVSWLKNNSDSEGPHKDKILSGIGGFSALFRADFQNMEKPLLVSCTDGVGTKLLLAGEFQSYRGVAQDLVAMCVNDLLCCGAEPLFFLDYFACGQLDLSLAQEFLSGLREACHVSNCALIGGETAEMPGVYQGKDFDCAGFAVGVVDEKKVLGPHRVSAGDVVMALPSSGFHSNGFSLVRQLFKKDIKEWSSKLLTPTRLYYPLVHGLKEASIPVKALAHITGGGMDNLSRVLPENTQLTLEAWQLPSLFLEAKKRGDLQWKGLLTTFNCGVGMAVIVSSEDEKAFVDFCKGRNEKTWKLGTLEEGSGPPRWSTDESQWEALNA